MAVSGMSPFFSPAKQCASVKTIKLFQTVFVGPLVKRYTGFLVFVKKIKNSCTDRSLFLRLFDVYWSDEKWSRCRHHSAIGIDLSRFTNHEVHRDYADRMFLSSWQLGSIFQIQLETMTSVVSSKTAWIPSLTLRCNALYTYSNSTGFCCFEQNNFNSEISHWFLEDVRMQFRHNVLTWPGFLHNMLDITSPTWWRKLFPGIPHWQNWSLGSVALVDIWSCGVPQGLVPGVQWISIFVCEVFYGYVANIVCTRP